MRKIKKEVIVGVTVVLSLGLLVWGINYLKGISIFSTTKYYYSKYDRIEGLAESSPVMVNGFKVGQVSGIEFHPKYDGSIIVRFSISEQNFRIPKQSRAKIASLDLLGSKAIDLILPETIDGYLNPGDTLISDVERSLSDEVNAQIAPLKSKAEELLASIDTAVTIVKVILNKEARTDLQRSFASIKNTFITFEKLARRLDTMILVEKGKIGSMTANLQSITNNIRNNNENITAILDNFRLISDSLSMSNLTTAVNNASIALTAASDIMVKIDEGEGTLGSLVNDDSLYINLTNASKNLDKLLIDLEAHPKRYVHFSIFGRKDLRAKEDRKKNRKDKKNKK